MADDNQLTVEHRLSTIEGFIDSALDAKTTRDMTTSAGYAQAAAVERKEYLEARLDARAYEDRRVPAIRAAIGGLSGAVDSAQKVVLGTDPPSMHARVVDFKSALDAALAQLREALSIES
jgi:hypothetical protein